MTRQARDAQIRRLRAEGKTYTQITAATGVSRSNCWHIVNDETTGPQLTCCHCGKKLHTPVTRRLDARTRTQARRPLRCKRCKDIAATVYSQRLLIELLLQWVKQYGEPPRVSDWSPAIARYFGLYDRAERYYDDGCWPSSATVMNHFGSWNAGLRAAGLPTRNAGRQYAA